MRAARPGPRAVLVAVAVLFLHPGPGSTTAGGAAPEPLRVRASEAFAPGLAPALEAFTRETGIAAVLDVRDPDPVGDADVVVGDDSELTRVLEGGAADIRTRFDLGYLPWVVVVPSRSPAAGVSALAAANRVYVLGGRLGGEARAAFKDLPTGRVTASRDATVLRQAAYALVPRSLAGPGEQRPSGVRPLIANAVAVSDSAHPVEAQKLLAFLKGPRGQALLAGSFVSAKEAGVVVGQQAAAVAYAASVVDWWLPDCTQRTNGYNDPQQVLGPPDAVTFGKDLYTGMMSLGQAGYVTVDMGVSAIDGPGADVRVYQTTSNEPLSMYGATAASGPFTLIALRRNCGDRSPGLLSNHCDFDLHDAGLPEARYFKIEDGEIYPCLAAGTKSEGADIDAVQILNQKP